MGDRFSPLLGATAKVATLPDVSVGHLLGHTLLALVVIVGGIWCVQKVWSRSRARGGTKGASRGGRTSAGLTVLSRHSLGKDQQLAVVRWGEREVLVGISGSTISFFDDGLGAPLPTHLTEASGSPATVFAADAASPSRGAAAAPAVSSGPPHRLTPSSFASSLSTVVAQRRSGATGSPTRAAGGGRPVLERLRDLTERS